MIRDAGHSDRAALETLLKRRIEGAMFALSNLRTHGLTKGDFVSDHPHASRFWLLDSDSIVALTRGGMVMPLISDDCDLAFLRPALAGFSITGAVGQVQSVRPVLSALGLTGLPMRLDEDEPGFSLDLSALRLPEMPGSILVPASDTPRDLLIDWRAAAIVETQGMSQAKAPAHAAMEVSGFLARDSHRVLLLDGTPVAMTGFNAVLSDIVQVGGVYTPPAFRSRGFGRQAVAMHLAEARAAGVGRAVLFAANAAAARAYRALGFVPGPGMSLVLFSSPATVSA